ncbi:white collar [Aspergillus nomiae NRRL 13137]|uniref:White collar n=1 Tax=Aspergillus nomiae NRRL (strain ATCC 15546 / NRRL 13137 / CBS 260.88 / M93) TaxID=1509407 RepID=A0A0L1JHW8_ASPN3|nr:white collar [Aspergillus nomiae NRRL 13137]KNG91359.1 white collar [Aspergillus nomiae NRRL 13137]
MERYTCFDTDSLRSYTSTVALDDYPPSNPPDELITSFPRPPSGARNLDSIPAHSPRTSIKTLRRNYMIHELPLLQEPNPWDGSDQFHPVQETGCSYDLIVPFSDSCEAPLHSLERLADIMFSAEHMLSILNNPRYLARFREFLLEERPRSLELLTYYLNTCKALKAIEYANALVRCAVDLPPPTIAITEPVGESSNPALQRRVHEALQALTDEELPAFITSRCIGITSRVVEERVRGTLPRKFQGTSDALAEVFCLTDPSRRDNPIIFASGEFHRTTQYGMDYVLGRNCRFLQGPKTNPNSVRRIREAIEAGRHHSELFLNYRRDGSPFMNLLQCAPLCDSQGTVRYFIGAQIDVSGLAMEGAQMDSLCALLDKQRNMKAGADVEEDATIKEDIRADELRELSELFSPRELNVVHQVGGSLFKPGPAVYDRNWKGHNRTWSTADTVEMEAIRDRDIKTALFRGSLTGVYENYLLVRPYPSLRILFTSPALQIPGILQSSFLSRIGGNASTREDLLDAFMAGNSVTARIKWVTRFNPQGRDRWVHCTPLLASNGEVGVWMVVVVDDH